MLLFALGVAGSWSGLGRSAILEYSAFLLPRLLDFTLFIEDPFCPLDLFALYAAEKKLIDIMAKFTTHCLACGTLLELDDDWANLEVQCPQCDAQQLVPDRKNMFSGDMAYNTQIHSNPVNSLQNYRQNQTSQLIPDHSNMFSGNMAYNTQIHSNPVNSLQNYRYNTEYYNQTEQMPYSSAYNIRQPTSCLSYVKFILAAIVILGGTIPETKTVAVNITLGILYTYWHVWMFQFICNLQWSQKMIISTIIRDMCFFLFWSFFAVGRVLYWWISFASGHTYHIVYSIVEILLLTPLLFCVPKVYYFYKFRAWEDSWLSPEYAAQKEKSFWKIIKKKTNK